MNSNPTLQLNEYSYRLFARPSFLEGFSRIFDFGNTLNLYNSSESEAEADYDALKSDWMAVGIDMSNAITTYERESA